MAGFIYNISLIVIFPAFFIWFLLQRFLYGKFRRGFLERFGCIKMEGVSRQGSAVWIHAASVGEIMAAESILTEFHSDHPDIQLFLTTNTDTGYEIAQKRLTCLTGIYQSPLDYPFVISRFIRIIKPSALVIMETELWPNMITLASEAGIPIMVANGRISDRSFPRYKRLVPFFRPVLQRVTLFAMQSREDADRINHLGARPKAVTTVGNVKFDRIALMNNQSDLVSLLNCPGWDLASKVIVAGSTHPEEEPIILKAFSAVKMTIREIRLILAPRHLHRIQEVLQNIKQFGLQYLCRSELTGSVKDREFLKDIDVIVLDTIGELAAAYNLGCIAFVGGSLQKIGGHNVLEPAALAKPVLFGPYTENFRDSVRQILNENAGRCVRNAEEMEACFMELMTHPEEAEMMGKRGMGIVMKNRGAVLRHVRLLDNLLINSLEHRGVETVKGPG
ncbi:3-deoxy-D-manno-octulosonic acid transferase [bacterium]|nr:3-deoxy-D-manno-octulosonic acid transferase [candidate division CSSED10-310 bacterium]